MQLRILQGKISSTWWWHMINTIIAFGFTNLLTRRLNHGTNPIQIQRFQMVALSIKLQASSVETITAKALTTRVFLTKHLAPTYLHFVTKFGIIVFTRSRAGYELNSWWKFTRSKDFLSLMILNDMKPTAAHRSTPKNPGLMRHLHSDNRYYRVYYNPKKRNPESGGINWD